MSVVAIAPATRITPNMEGWIQKGDNVYYNYDSGRYVKTDSNGRIYAESYDPNNGFTEVKTTPKTIELNERNKESGEHEGE